MCYGDGGNVLKWEVSYHGLCTVRSWNDQNALEAHQKLSEDEFESPHPSP